LTKAGGNKLNRGGRSVKKERKKREKRRKKNQKVFFSGRRWKKEGVGSEVFRYFFFLRGVC